MKIKEAINRLGYTISKQNKPNSTDADALNSIIDFINNTNKVEVQENKLFAKLYIMNFITQMRIVRDFDLAQSNVNKILKMPLDGLYNEFRKEANVLEIKNYFESKGLKDTWSMMSNFDLKENFKANTELCNKIDTKEFLEVCDMWSEENIYNNLNATITLAINTYKNV
jgi:hypothetical protein